MNLTDYIGGNLPPSVVSLWLPSGQSRAMDLIRGNHGQCYGTHPNVPVLPSLINPSVGWHFDGTDDYVDCGNDKSLAVAQWTMGCWVYRNKVDGAPYERLVSKSSATEHDYRFQISEAGAVHSAFYDTVGNPYSVETTETISLVEWAFLIATFDGTYIKIYINGTLKATSADFSAFTPRTSTRNLWIGRFHNLYDFNGYIALPFIANKAWSQQQVNNFYLATKGLFAPRG